MAENLFGTGNGSNKKEYVMTKLINIALASHTKYNLNELDKRVEDVVKATKNVNIKAQIEEQSESVDETFQEEIETKPEQSANFIVVGDYKNVQNNTQNSEKVGDTNGTNN